MREMADAVIVGWGIGCVIGLVVAVVYIAVDVL